MVLFRRFEGRTDARSAAARGVRTDLQFVWVFVIPIGIISVLMSWDLIPPTPAIPNRENFERTERQQWAGQHQCQPDQISQITSAVDKEKRRDECKIDAERYREEKDERWYSALAALSAQQSAVYAWHQAFISAISTSILILALIGSTWAAMNGFRAASAADQTLIHSRKSAERQMRAYVVLKSAMINTLAADRPIEVTFTVTNTGQTPAHFVTVWCAVAIKPYPNPKFEEGTSQIQNPSRPVLGNGVEYVQVVRSPFMMDTHDLGLILGGTHAVYCWGEISYHDVFMKLRHTRWRTFIGGSFGVGGNLMASSEEGNASD